MRASRLVRGGWTATVLLAVVIGLAAGLAMTASAAGRRTTVAFDRFLEEADPPELLANLCPAGLAVSEETLIQCLLYDAADEREVLAGLPEVESAVRASFRGVTFPDPSGDGSVRGLAMLVSPDAAFVDPGGHPLVLEGRFVDPTAPDEIVVNEATHRATGLSVGDEIELTFWADDEIGSVATGREFSGTSLPVEVVGIVRTLTDLGAGDRISGSAEQHRVFAGPGVAAATPDVVGFGAVLVDLRDGISRSQAETIVRGALPDNEVNLTPAVSAAELEPVREAMSYEARSAIAVGALASLATAVFAAQAIARQVRREWHDLVLLRAIGVTTRQTLLAAALRGVVIALGVVVVAVAVAVALSPVGPVGSARHAAPDPGVAADGLVLGVGSLLVVAVVLGAATLPVLREGARRERRTDLARGARALAWAPLPARAGLDMVRRRAGGALPLGTAVLGAALAIGVLVAAIGLQASLRDLQATPERFGAPWDLSVTGAPRETDDVGAAIAGLPEVAAAAAITGNDVEIDGEVAWVHAYVPIEGVDRVIGLPISAGRAPIDATEIALGSTLLADLGLSIGDTVEVSSTASASTSRLTVVGTTIVNDNYERSPGHGGAVHPSWVERYAPEATSDPYVMELVDGADIERVREVLAERTQAEVVPPVPQEAIRNVERIRALPMLLAALVGFLAAASLIHAAILSVRRSHLDLAVLRSLGFTRRQVVGAVVTHVLALVAVAAVIGVPLGIIAARWGWRAVAEQIGVPDVPVLPLQGVALSALVAVAAGLAASWFPAWRARRLALAQTLRTE